MAKLEILLYADDHSPVAAGLEKILVDGGFSVTEIAATKAETDPRSPALVMVVLAECGLPTFLNDHPALAVAPRIVVLPESTVDWSRAWGLGYSDVITRPQSSEEVLGRVQRQLQHTARHAGYQTFFEASTDSMQILEDGVFVDCNHATAKMLGYESRDEIIRISPWAISPERQPDGEPSRDKAARLLEKARNEGSHCFEWTHTRKNGELFVVEVQLTAAPERDRSIFHSVWRDLSARKRAKQLEIQLRQSQKMEAVGQLAGGIAHDFNNLLQAIMGHAELVALRAKMGEDVLPGLDNIRTASEQAAKLVRQLLAFGRQQVLELETRSLPTVVEEFVQLVDRVLGKNISVRTESSPVVRNVTVDRSQIEQLLMNLCVNARDAMPEGGEIHIACANADIDETTRARHGCQGRGDFVCLTVSDQGVGIAADQIDHIFEPFFTTKATGEGTGLGLSTVYGIVQQHGGFIEVDSKPGGGTTFRVFLVASDQPEVVAGDDHASEPPTGNETILVAEDDEGVRAWITALLEGAGYEVLVTTDGQEAIAKWEASRDTIDLALLDVVMPRVSGNEVYEHIRNRDPDLPIVFLSGYGPDDLHSSLAAHEGVLVLPKPIQRRRLLDELRAALDRVANSTR